MRLKVAMVSGGSLLSGVCGTKAPAQGREDGNKHPGNKKPGRVPGRETEMARLDDGVASGAVRILQSEESVITVRVF
jgi:hypothetical protein